MNKTIIKVISIIMVLSLAMLTFAACGGDEDYTKVNGETSTTETTTEAPKATNVNPFTGEANLSEAAIGARPVAVMVENHPEARPQWGMSTPDVVIEGLVEGGITRMMWLYAHWGGSGQASGLYAYGALKQYDVDNIDGLTYAGKYFKRDASRTGGVENEHTGYTSGELLTKAISDLKIETKAKDNNWTMFKVVEDGIRLPFGGASGGANEVNVTFSSSYKYTFKYMMDKNVYTSYLNGKKITDGTNGADVAYSNIIIMFTNVDGVQTTNANDKKLREWDLTSGEALWISNGSGEKITWKKDGATSPLKFYGTDGKELVVNKGRTWIGVVPTDQRSNFNIKES